MIGVDSSHRVTYTVGGLLPSPHLDLGHRDSWHCAGWSECAGVADSNGNKQERPTETAVPNPERGERTDSFNQWTADAV